MCSFIIYKWKCLSKESKKFPFRKGKGFVPQESEKYRDVQMDKSENTQKTRRNDNMKTEAVAVKNR